MGMSLEEYKRIVFNDNSLKPKKVNMQIQGKVNRERGKQFEEEIENLCEIYKINNLAIVEKTPEPMKILKHIDSGKFETVFEKSAQPDFKGTIKGGKTVVFDAKFTGADKITYQALSDHQRDILKEYNDLGAKAFVLVGFADGGIYNIDINTWINMKEIYGTKHIKKQDLVNSEFEVKRNKNGMMDFLDIL